MRGAAMELPHNKSTEEALVGAVLIDPGAYEVIAPTLRAADLHNGRARIVYTAIEKLRSRGDQVDHVTLADHLESTGQLTEIGGAAYLTHLVNVVPSALHVEDYAQLIQEDATRRDLIRAASDAVKAAYDEESDIEEVVARFEAAVLGARREVTRLVTAYDACAELYEDVSYWANHPDETRGLPTGLVPLDRTIGGLEPGLYILAARPSMGKTALALQIAANVAKAGRKVLIFTLEMGAKQLMLRLACAEAKVAVDTVRRGVSNTGELLAVHKAMGVIADWPLVLHTGTVTAGDIRAVVQRESLGEAVGLVVVDYLGLMAASKRANTRNLELGAISRGLLLAAKGLDTPILAIHQLNRGVDQRSERQPRLSDLRESGRLEEDADVVLMLYRSGYYWPERADADVMEIWVRKNRLGGPAGSVCKMYWRGELMRCEPLTTADPGALELVRSGDL